MLGVVTELQRVTIGPVIIVAAGVTRKRNYWPACEGLMWEWWKRGGESQLYRPCYWHRVGIPGSGQSDWFRSDVEYVMCFKRPGALAWSDNTAMGHPPKWAPGGAMAHRLSNGQRVNQWGPVGGPRGGGGRNADGTSKASRMQAANGNGYPSHKITMVEKLALGGKPHTKRDASSQTNGEAMRSQVYLPPVKANPGNVVKIIVGGGTIGSRIAHENEAPFPEKLAEWFIKSLCREGGRVYDPFSGSGTTACVAARLGRIGIGSDLRMSQCQLGARRWNEPVKIKRKGKARPKQAHEMLLFGAA